MKIFYNILFLFVFSFANAQTKKKAITSDKEPLAAVKVIARVQKDKLLLRWGVTDPLAWKKSNKYGYKLERYTIVRDKKTLTKPEKIVIAELIKPEAMATWEALIDVNENAAIIAQAIYGEKFETTSGSDLENIVNQSEEIEQRFTFALYAADKDFEIAKKAGLGYEDTTVKANEKYAYRVTSNVPVKEMKIEYGGVFVSMQEFETLPKPMDFTASFGDGNAQLSWNFKILEHAYGSYYIERATDDKPFERITAKPYASINQDNTNSNRTFYLDSIGNNQKYNYRIQGITAFGELGPYSDVVFGKGKAGLKYTPHLTIKDFKNDTDVTLTWEFPEQANEAISGFELIRSDTDEGEYTTVVKNIAPKERTVTYTKLQPTNYFKIKALGKNGDSTNSFAMLVQPVDSIPPSKPLNLKAVIDSTGVVKINWDANKEKDLQGYRIYRANNASEEFTQLTVSPHEPNNYQDKVMVKNLNSKVYYKIIAVDMRYNMSEFSEVLVVKKPDFIPPTSPVFSNYEINEGVVTLSWINSQSADVVSHQLYRKQKDQTDWQLIMDSKDKNETYQDKTITATNTYNYAIYAKDESNLTSKPSPQLALWVSKAMKTEDVKGFFAKTNLQTNTIDLSWNYKANPDLQGFELYKATATSPMQLMQIVEANRRLLPDPTITINTSYKYGIRAVFKDGRYSKMEFFDIKF